MVVFYYLMHVIFILQEFVMFGTTCPMMSLMHVVSVVSVEWAHVNLSLGPPACPNGVLSYTYQFIFQH